MAALQRGGRCLVRTVARREKTFDRGNEFRDFGQPAGAGFIRLGHFSDGRADKVDAVGLELSRISPGGGMLPHMRVHGGSDQDRLVGREQHGGCQVARVATRHLGHQVRGGGGDDDQIRFTAQANMSDLTLVVEIEQIREDAIVRQRTDGQRRDERLRRLRHHHAHGDLALAQAANEVEALVGGDAAADDEKYPLVQQVLPLLSRLPRIR